MSTSAPSMARLKEILRRQDPPSWSPDYIPAILAERTEAPSHSRPILVQCPKLGRECHVLSLNELPALLLALYNPAVFEIHEQRMLAMEPRPHPLEGHPRAAGMLLPQLEGTIAVADRLNLLRRHKWLKTTNEDGETIRVPYPWIGDFLIFVSDQQGPYCVNWTVKQDSEDFSRSMSRDRPIRDPGRDEFNSRSRHAIEEIYYRDAGIRTVRVVKRDFPDKLVANLRRSYASLGYPINWSEDLRQRVLDRLRGCLLTARPPMEVFLALCRQFDVDVPGLKSFMEQAIWHRELRVDLNGDPIHPDQPLRPESTDVLQMYASWFERGEA